MENSNTCRSLFAVCTLHEFLFFFFFLLPFSLPALFSLPFSPLPLSLPPFLPLDGLLKMLYMILLHQAMRHPGAPKSAPHAPPATPSTGSLPEADIGSVTLALQTLGSFNFGGNYLLPMHQMIWLCILCKRSNTYMYAIRLLC